VAEFLGQGRDELEVHSTHKIGVQLGQAAWLAGIIVNLLLVGDYYDVALRDFGLLVGALALARLRVTALRHRRRQCPIALVSWVRTRPHPARRGSTTGRYGTGRVQPWAGWCVTIGHGSPARAKHSPRRRLPATRTREPTTTPRATALTSLRKLAGLESDPRGFGTTELVGDRGVRRLRIRSLPSPVVAATARTLTPRSSHLLGPRRDGSRDLRRRVSTAARPRYARPGGQPG
jgi:hypothetical protein